MRSESPKAKDVRDTEVAGVTNVQHLLRQLREQAVTQGDFAAMRQEMLTLRMVVNAAKTEMIVANEREVGEVIAKERLERAEAARLLEDKVAHCLQQLQTQHDEQERLRGQLESAARESEERIGKLTGSLTSSMLDSCQALEKRLRRVEEKEGYEMKQLQQDLRSQMQSLQTVKVQLEQTVQETCQQFQAEQGQELLEVRREAEKSCDALEQAVRGLKERLQDTGLKMDQAATKQDVLQLSQRVQGLLDQTEASMKKADEQGRSLCALRDDLQSRTGEMRDQMSVMEQKQSSQEASAARADAKVMQMGDSMTQVTEAMERRWHDEQAQLSKQLAVLEASKEEALRRLETLDKASSELREACEKTGKEHASLQAQLLAEKDASAQKLEALQVAQMKQSAQEQERWHDRFADSLQRVAGLEAFAAAAGKDKKALDEELHRLQGYCRQLDTSTVQATQVLAQHAEMQRRLEDRVGGVEVREVSASEKLARLLARDKMLEDLDAKVTGLQPCAAHCEKLFASVHDLQAAQDASTDDRKLLKQKLDQRFAEVQRSQSQAKDSWEQLQTLTERLSAEADALNGSQAVLCQQVESIQSSLPNATVTENQKEIYAVKAVLKQLQDQVTSLPKAHAELQEHAQVLAETRQRELESLVAKCEKSVEDDLQAAQCRWAADKASSEAHVAAVRQKLAKMEADSTEVQLGQAAATKGIQDDLESLASRLATAEQQQDRDSQQLSGRIAAAQASAESDVASLRQHIAELEAESAEAQSGQRSLAQRIQDDVESLRSRLATAEQQQVSTQSDVAAVRQREVDTAEALTRLEGQLEAAEQQQAAATGELRKMVDAELAGAQAALRERLTEILERLPELVARLDDQSGELEALRTRQEVNYGAVDALQASYTRVVQEVAKTASRAEQLAGLISEEQQVRQAEAAQMKQGAKETAATFTTQLEDLSGMFENFQRSASDVDAVLARQLEDASKRLGSLQAEQLAAGEQHNSQLQNLHENLLAAKEHGMEIQLRIEDVQRHVLPLEAQVQVQEESLGKLVSDQQARELKAAAVEERLESERAARELQRRELSGILGRERKAFERLTVLERSILAVDELARREMEARTRDTRRLWDALDSVSSIDISQDVDALPCQPLTSLLRLGGADRLRAVPDEP